MIADAERVMNDLRETMLIDVDQLKTESTVQETSVPESCKNYVSARFKQRTRSRVKVVKVSQPFSATNDDLGENNV